MSKHHSFHKKTSFLNNPLNRLIEQIFFLISCYKAPFMNPTLPARFILILFAFAFLNACNNSSESITKDTDTSSTENTTDDEDFADYDKFGSSEEKEKLVKKVNNLLVFHADDTMEVNQTYVATLALAKKANLESLTLKVLEASDAGDTNVITDTTIVIGKRMRARLWDPAPRKSKNFQIDAINSEEQNLGGTIKEAFWHWNIEPLKEGHHELKLSVEVIMSDDDKVGLPARDIPVTIFANKLTFGDKLGNFFSKYWQWVITGILIPLVIAWFTTWLKQRADQKSKSK